MPLFRKIIKNNRYYAFLIEKIEKNKKNIVSKYNI